MKGFKSLSAYALSLAFVVAVTSPAVFAQGTGTQNSGQAPSISPSGEGGGQKGFGQGQRHGRHGGGQGGQQGQGFSKEAREKYMSKMRSELNLTPEQEKKMQASMKTFKDQHQADREAMKAKFQEMKSLRESNGDPDKIKALRDDLSQMRQSMRAKHEAMQKSILTPEQFGKWQQMQKEHQSQFKGMQGGGFGGQGGGGQHRRHGGGGAPGGPGGPGRGGAPGQGSGDSGPGSF